MYKLLLVMQKETYCQETAYRASVTCTLSTGKQSFTYERCEVDGSRTFWSFFMVCLLITAIAGAVVHWRKKRLHHQRELRMARMVNS
jgi:hypothetical protein